MAGICVEVIAEKLGRHRSAIFRELRLNSFEDQQMPDLNGYDCVTANSMTREQRANDVSSRGSRICVNRLSTTSYMAGRRSRLLPGCDWSGTRSRSDVRRSTSLHARPTDMRSNRGDICRSMVPDAGYGMPAAVTAGVSAQTSSFSTGRMSSLVQTVRHWECTPIQFRKKDGKANVPRLVERVSRFAVFQRNNDRQSSPVMDGLICVPHLAHRSITFD